MVPAEKSAPSKGKLASMSSNCVWNFCLWGELRYSRCDVLWWAYHGISLPGTWGLTVSSSHLLWHRAVGRALNCLLILWGVAVFPLSGVDSVYSSSCIIEVGMGSECGGGCTGEVILTADSRRSLSPSLWSAMSQSTPCFQEWRSIEGNANRVWWFGCGSRCLIENLMMK